MWGCDRDEDALRVAARNVAALGLGERVVVRAGELLGAASGLRLEGRVHAVVCTASSRVGDAWAARVGRLLEEAAELLRLGGRAYVEVDGQRHGPLHAIARSHGSYEWLDFARDEAGRPCAGILRRVATRPGPQLPRRGACAVRSEATFATTRPRS